MQYLCLNILQIKSIINRESTDIVDDIGISRYIVEMKEKERVSAVYYYSTIIFNDKE